MNVLVTNDDGIHAVGIALLAECAEVVFGPVDVVAPASGQSGQSQALTLERPLRVEAFGDRRVAVDGTPVDSVFVALGHVMRGRRPELVLSGINHGANVGYDVYYSGTVGAAREALIHGIPAVALSLAARGTDAFDAIRPAVLRILERIRDHGVPPGVLLNVNIPDPRRPAHAECSWAGVPGLRGVRVTRLGRRTYGNELVTREDPRGRTYFWIGGAIPRMEDDAGTDCQAVLQGYVSITPLGLDVTAAAELDRLTPHFTEPAP